MTSRLLSMIGRPVTAAGGTEGSFIEKMKSRKKRLVVFYGSQTGTAEEFAARLAKDAARQGLPAMTFDPEDCSDWVSVLSSCNPSSLAVM